MSLAILFHFLRAQHVSDINTIHHQELATILLNYHIGLVVLGSMCVGVSVWLGWSGIRVAGWSSVPISNTHRTKNNKTNVVIQQNSRKILMMDILMPETCWAHKKWNKIASDMKLVFYSSTVTMMHGPINIRIKTHILYSIPFSILGQNRGIQKISVATYKQHAS